MTNFTVGIATKGRSEVLGETVRELRRQTYPHKVLICATTPADVASVANEPDVTILYSTPGSASQRNGIIDAAGEECNVILFQDDDYFPQPNYVEVMARAFESDPDLAVTTGFVIADGIHGPGIQPAEARRMLGADNFDGELGAFEVASSGYGCNTAVRMSIVNTHHIRFDEELPLYAWFEDVDFTRRVGRYGRTKKLLGARGIHLGTKMARAPGMKLGYSQVANPVHLWRKRSFSTKELFENITRNFGANILKSITGDRYVDRWGRVLGNCRAFGDCLLGRLDPQRILEFD